MENILEMRKISKSFPGVQALSAVDFSLKQGEIHGLVGENGAGKSTLMKILAGIYSPTTGEIFVKNQSQLSLTPKIVESLGIYFIHQERYVVPTLTVAQTLFLGKEKQFIQFGRINRKQMEREATAVIKSKLQIDLDGGKLISSLTVGEQQLVQICRAIYQEPTVLVFDEPTAVLAKQEKDTLFRIIRNLQKRGISIIYISHYFNEILEVCERITVLRDGKKVSTMNTNQLEIADIVYQITGKEVLEDKVNIHTIKGKQLLETQNLTKKGSFENISLEVHQGEIVGLTGLMGSGHDQLATALYHHKQLDSGEVWINGRQVKMLTPEKAVALGIGYIPEDRRNHGIIKKMTVRENITLANLKNIKKFGVLQSKKERQIVQQLIDRLQIRTPNQQEEVEFLSGGNQQKVVLSKWLHSGAKLFILHQPTAAVDVGAKEEIYQLMKELVEQGAGILLISQDLKELERLSDYTLVMYRGKITERLLGDRLTLDQLMISIMGREKNEPISDKQNLSI